MKLDDIDTSNLKYDPKSKNSLKKLEKEFPEFMSHLKAGVAGSKKEYDLEPFRENVIKYIILLYDKNSPLWSTIQDFNHRKITALELAGFEVDLLVSKRNWNSPIGKWIDLKLFWLKLLFFRSYKAYDLVYLNHLL
mgnify:CR=1 FL=1